MVKLDCPRQSRLCLPESWPRDVARMDKAGVPASLREYRTKPEIAIEEIDRVIAAGVRLRAGRCWLWTVRPVPAGAERARPLRGRRHPPAPEGLPSRRATDLPGGASRSREVASSQLAQGNDGPPGRALCRRACAHCRRSAPADRLCRSPAHTGEEVWLVGEHRSNGERKYDISNLPDDIPIKALAGAIKARWICEQTHQQLKEELGMDHFEGRSWTGLHRHALMTMMACVFLQSRRIARAARKKESSARRRNPACQQRDKPFLTTCHTLHRRNAIVAGGR